jgi:hypothetical protein
MTRDQASAPPLASAQWKLEVEVQCAPHDFHVETHSPEGFHGQWSMVNSQWSSRLSVGLTNESKDAHSFQKDRVRLVDKITAKVHRRSSVY